MSYAASSAKAAPKMNTTSCSVPPRQGKMFSSTPSSRTSVTTWPISSRNSRWMVSRAYSPNSTWPPSGRWNGGSRPSTCSDTSNAPSRGRLMTAIALMICRLALTGPSYHAGPMTLPPARRYRGNQTRETPMTDQAFITCRWFDTEAEQAASFYTGIFKDSTLGRVYRHTEAGPGLGDARRVRAQRAEVLGPERRPAAHVQRGGLDRGAVRGPGRRRVAVSWGSCDEIILMWLDGSVLLILIRGCCCRPMGGPGCRRITWPSG